VASTLRIIDFQGDPMTMLSVRRPFSPIDPESLAARVMEFAPATDAEALKILRASFPDCPLSARVAAIDFLMRRRPRLATPYIPR
jgi:hypothetical protein